MRSDPPDRFRTLVTIPESDSKIGYSTPVLFIGSCFSGEMAAKMEEGKMKVVSNPFGTVYNPLSVAKTLEILSQGVPYKSEDLINYNGKYLSFDHYTTFSGERQEDVLAAVNKSVDEGEKYLETTKFLFITFGTAWVYRLKSTGALVSNCHKIPSSQFTREMLSPEQIVEKWSRLLDNLRTRYPSMEVWFTVSPVRHWKDGAHGNQVSKSVLHLAIEGLLSHPAVGGYFPSYEILSDELRDYRFYADDMLHPSKSAVDYIWDRFSESFMMSNTVSQWKEIRAVTLAKRHRFDSASGMHNKVFAESMLGKIERLTLKYPDVSFVADSDHFLSIIKQQS